MEVAAKQKIPGNIEHTLLEALFYSVRRLFTGFSLPAFIVWNAINKDVISPSPITENRKGFGVNEIL